MVPFSVRQKHEIRNGRLNVAFIQYVEINVFNNDYRLLKKDNKTHKYTINGIIGPNDYEDKINGVRIYIRAGNLIFSTQFGLTLTWNGDHRIDVNLCNTYSGFVCGLCGNGDGLLSNDHVDRENNIMDFLNMSSIFRWASTWRVPDNSIDTIDLDRTSCNPLNSPGAEPVPVTCKNQSLYLTDEWCGRIINSNGPWSKCLEHLDKKILEGIYESCLFDVCATESSIRLQNENKCNSYEQLASQCNLVISSVDTMSNWRIETRCCK